MSKIVLKKPEDMPLFRRAASVHTQCFVMIEKMLQEQQWTLRAIDEAVHEFIRAHGCSASFYGYSKYPAALCMSVNDEVVHTIPDDRIVGSGDIVSVDLGVQYKHCMVDSGKTIYV